MRSFRLLSIVLLGAGFCRADSIRVGVAISLKDAMDQISRSYEAETGVKVALVYGSSGQIAAQISSGAPIDVFISAANKQIDDLTRQSLVQTETRKVVAGNSLVLVVPADAKDPPAGFKSLAGTSVKRLAIGDPRSVPAGDYAMQVLKHLKLDDGLKGRLIYGANVRQVLSYVERGEVDAGIVYSTDAKLSSDKVKVIATAPAESHEPIVYPAVIVKGSDNPDAAKRFLEYVGTDKARQTLTKLGFTAGGASTDGKRR
jgi:molybdate transport system substrate-binding protein